jgi:hypothetical protein
VIIVIRLRSTWVWLYAIVYVTVALQGLTAVFRRTWYELGYAHVGERRRVGKGKDHKKMIRTYGNEKGD